MGIWRDISARDLYPARRAGFTLAELVIVVIAVVLTLLVLLNWGWRKIQAKAMNAGCAANLHSLGKAMKMYDSTLTGKFPTIRGKFFVTDISAMNEPPTAANAIEDWIQPSLPTLGNCPMQGLWPLIAEGPVSPAVFRCPGDDACRERQSNLRYGWTSPNQFSYGVQWPYSGVQLGDASRTILPNHAHPYGRGRSDQLVILADQNPGGAVGAGKIEHSNHSDGCNTLAVDGSVGQYRNSRDSKAGMDGDDIYVNQVVAGVKPARPDAAAADNAIPVSPSDTVIVPVSMPKEK